jgi:hypothetical protein
MAGTITVMRECPWLKVARMKLGTKKVHAGGEKLRPAHPAGGADLLNDRVVSFGDEYGVRHSTWSSSRSIIIPSRAKRPKIRRPTASYRLLP